MIDRAHPPDPLDLLFERCSVLADRVARGELNFLDAVDTGWEAAIWSGLVDRVGADLVQSVLAAAFVGVRQDHAA